MLLWLPAGNGENSAGFLIAPMERMDSVAVDRLETVPGGLVTSDLLGLFLCFLLFQASVSLFKF